MIDIRYCKKCKKAFDIDTSKELCPACRLEKLREVNTKWFNDKNKKKCKLI